MLLATVASLSKLLVILFDVNFLYLMMSFPVLYL